MSYFSNSRWSLIIKYVFKVYDSIDYPSHVLKFPKQPPKEVLQELLRTATCTGYTSWINHISFDRGYSLAKRTSVDVCLSLQRPYVSSVAGFGLGYSFRNAIFRFWDMAIYDKSFVVRQWKDFELTLDADSWCSICCLHEKTRSD